MAPHSPTCNLALLVAYDGAPFSGFARQEGRATVQGALEAALATALHLGEQPETVGAGRTDAGVHARGQVVTCLLPAAAFPEPTPDACARLRRSLDALAGPAIVVRDLAVVDPAFSARFSATARTYRYRIARGAAAPLFTAPYVWHVAQDLDEEAMATAARSLIGEHDFASFCVSASAAELHERGLSTRRNVHSVRFFEETPLGEPCLTCEVVGNAFLHSMVRTVVGSLVEVGVGRREPSWLADVLAAADRAAAGPTAPARGLTFEAVTYPEEVFAHHA